MKRDFANGSNCTQQEAAQSGTDMQMPSPQEECKYFNVGDLDDEQAAAAYQRQTKHCNEFPMELHEFPIEPEYEYVVALDS